MSQALFTSMTGLNTAQQQISVVSNNVANINTTAFKSADARFATLFSNTLTTGNAPSATAGGTNPKQIGMGVQTASITRNFTEGSYLSTGNSEDLMISGKGYFTVMDPSGKIYMTRDGSFTMDAEGNLTNALGYKVLGANSLFSSESNASPIKIPQSFSADIKGTEQLDQVHMGNLNNAQFTSGKVDFSYNGTDYQIEIPESAVAPGESVTSFVGALNTAVAGIGNITFAVGTGDNAGTITLKSDEDLKFLESSSANLAKVLQIGEVTGGAPNPTPSKILDYSVDINPTASVTDTISLKAYSVGADGSIEATYTDGSVLTVELKNNTDQFQFVYKTPTGVIIKDGEQNIEKTNVNPQVANTNGMILQMASITNESGLVSLASNLWQPGPNSGDIVYTVGNQLGLGSVQTNGLESSNVDLARELSNMIIAQRAISANSRVFGTASSVLEQLSNLGR